jgi:multiple sugar transport system substrate-binding protein
MNEQAAMMTIGDWAIAPMKQGNPGLDYGIAPLPSDVQRATVMGGYTLGVTTTSRQPSAAWDFVRWLTAKPQEWILEGYSRIPARPDVAATTFGRMPLEQGFLEQAGYGRPQPSIPQWFTIATTSMSNAWDATIRRVVSPEQGLKQAVADSNKVLATAVTADGTGVESGGRELARKENFSEREGGLGRERLVTRTEPASRPPHRAVRDA